jgi:hypothetical protein
MKDLEQRIIIAIFAGIYPCCVCRRYHFDKDDAAMGYRGSVCSGFVPDYLNDTTAITEVCRKLHTPSGGTWPVFLSNLVMIVSRDQHINPDSVSFPFEMVLATARQKCEALIRTINKWEGEPLNFPDFRVELKDLFHKK